jgi:hypothetical protein
LIARLEELQRDGSGPQGSDRGGNDQGGRSRRGHFRDREKVIKPSFVPEALRLEPAVGGTGAAVQFAMLLTLILFVLVIMALRSISCLALRTQLGPLPQWGLGLAFVLLLVVLLSPHHVWW